MKESLIQCPSIDPRNLFVNSGLKKYKNLIFTIAEKETVTVQNCLNNSYGRTYKIFTFVFSMYYTIVDLLLPLHMIEYCGRFNCIGSFLFSHCCAFRFFYFCFSYGWFVFIRLIFFCFMIC